jgi:hypothetical protein
MNNNKYTKRGGSNMLDTAEQLMEVIDRLSNRERIKFLSMMNKKYFDRKPMTEQELLLLLEDLTDDWSDLNNGKE